MKEEILKRIDAVAEKFGVTSGQLWQIFVAQQKVEGFSHLAWAFFNSIVVVAGVFAFRWGNKKLKETSLYTDEDTCYIVMIVGSIVSLLFSLFVLINLDCAFTEFLNPDYAAFKTLVNMLKQ